MSTGKFSYRVGLMVLLMCLLMTYACTRVEDKQRAGSLLIVENVVGIVGTLSGTGGTEGNPLFSDVLTCNDDHTKCAIVNDNARVSFRDQFLQVGTGVGITPTYLSDIIVNRYRIDYTRPNGMNTPGVDVPYAVDGTLNVYVATGASVDGVITVVRHEAKSDPPLHDLLTDRHEVVTAQANIHFWGQDVAGRTVSALGFLEIHFADFGP